MTRTPRQRRGPSSAGRLLADLRSGLLDLVLPDECAACHQPGTPWCGRCDRGLRAAFLDPRVPVHPDPTPTGLPPCHARGSYEGPLRLALRAYKDGGRRDLAPLLGGLLAEAVAAAADSAGWPVAQCLLVPVPSSRRAERQRGDVPLEALAHRAADEVGTSRVRPALVHMRRVADQAGLAAGRRAANLAGALAVRPAAAASVRGARIIVVDDVMTTGSTLAEAARCLRAAGAGPVVAATVAATRLRRDPPATVRRGSDPGAETSPAVHRL